MNVKNLLTQRVEGAYMMDRTSHRYRKCPNDGHEFMTNNLSRIYCSDHCADEFHNQKKKMEAEQLQKKKAEQTLEIKEIKQLDTTIVTSPLVGNIHLIGTTLGNKQFLKVYKNYLTDKGLDFGVYDHKFRLPGTELNVLTYGPYAIAWGYEDYIILTYKKNIPWIQ